MSDLRWVCGYDMNDGDPAVLDKQVPAGRRRITPWEPFAAVNTYYGQGGTSMTEASPVAWGLNIVWRCQTDGGSDV